ncbi:MAG: helix-hairpin-helix domain-containing protein [Nitrosomonadales bacterium]|nr:helix-hairpin-helix domain-containing protein [Nitrosomonadales bacterium]
MREQHRDDDPPAKGNRNRWLLIGTVLAIIFGFALVSPRIPTHGTTTLARPAVVNVNRASLAELDALPHISEAVAQSIIDGRPYSSVDDLIRIYGIGPKTLESIRPYVKVKDENPPP